MNGGVRCRDETWSLKIDQVTKLKKWPSDQLKFSCKPAAKFSSTWPSDQAEKVTNFDQVTKFHLWFVEICQLRSFKGAGSNNAREFSELTLLVESIDSTLAIDWLSYIGVQMRFFFSEWFRDWPVLGPGSGRTICRFFNSSQTKSTESGGSAI